MVRRAEVPEDIVEAIQRAWPDGVVQMIDLDEVPAWGSHSALKTRLSRIAGSELVHEHQAGGGPTHAAPSTPKPSSRTSTASNGASPDRGGSATPWRSLWWRLSLSSL